MVTNVQKNRYGSNDVVTVQVERLAHGGEGVGPQTDGEFPGRMVFARGTAPGDIVKVELSTSKKRFARGSVVEVEEEGPGRQESPCHHSDLCGGCAWLHVTPEVQRNALQANLEFAYRRLVSSPDVFQPLRFGASLGYRQRVRLHCRWRQTGVQLGFREARGPGIVPISDCKVASPAIREMLNTLKPILGSHTAVPRGQGSVTIMEDGKGDLFLLLAGPWATPILSLARDLGFAGVALEGKNGREYAGRHVGIWPQTDGRADLRVLNGGFTQANGEVTQLLIEDLRAELAAHAPEKVLELFCGSGTLTIPLFDGSKGTWTGIDAAEDAVMTLRETLVDEEQLSLFVASAPNEVPPRIGGGVDLCLMDPPREGAADWLEWLADKELDTILYVSCDPMTQVRDVEVLVGSGYEIKKIIGYDMFPNTGHIETLAILVRGGTQK